MIAANANTDLSVAVNLMEPNFITSLHVLTIFYWHLHSGERLLYAYFYDADFMSVLRLVVV